jgi:hypothetical protein
MGTGGYLLFLLLAAIISVQFLILGERRTSLDDRLRDLSIGGDAFLLTLVAMLISGALGALLGHFFDAPGPGAAIGLCVALLVAGAGITWAHRRRPGRNKR